MRVYFVQGDDLCGPTVQGSLEDALTEIRFLLSAEEEGAGFGVRVEIGEMTEEEFDALPEFGGY